MKNNIIMKKDFNIGEYARGGVITVIISEGNVTLISREWDFSKGSTKKSDQSNSRELYRFEVSTNDSEAEYKLRDWLLEESTSYYCDVIMEWIYSKTTFKNEFNWF
jgi:major membrane immunogen (membrane-anchored lipoprotein)